MGLDKPTAELSVDDMPAIRDTLSKLGQDAAQFTDVVSSQTALCDGRS